MKPPFSAEEHEAFQDAKKRALEGILGPMDEVVGHALIPFALGGPLDMYYFSKGIPGTGFATMELIQPDGTGPKPNRVGTFELVTFTRLTRPFRHAPNNLSHPFSNIEHRMRTNMTTIAYYSFEAVLSPGETCEFPMEEDGSNRCLILDNHDPNGAGFILQGRKHGLLLCLELHRREMEYAMKKGSRKLLKILRKQGVYPYSDLNREPVV